MKSHWQTLSPTFQNRTWKRQNLRDLQVLQLHGDGDSLPRAAGTRNKEGAGWLNGNFEFFLLFSVLECLPWSAHEAHNYFFNCKANVSTAALWNTACSSVGWGCTFQEIGKTSFQRIWIQYFSKHGLGYSHKRRKKRICRNRTLSTIIKYLTLRYLTGMGKGKTGFTGELRARTPQQMIISCSYG